MPLGESQQVRFTQLKSEIVGYWPPSPLDSRQIVCYDLQPNGFY